MIECLSLYVPNHRGIRGNESADNAAETPVYFFLFPEIEFPITTFKSLSKLHINSQEVDKIVASNHQPKQIKINLTYHPPLINFIALIPLRRRCAL